MAEDLGDGEFWLPPKFLYEEGLLTEFGKMKQESSNNRGGTNEFGNGLTRLNSDMSSPGESVVGSTETESDEDDYLFGLNRKFAHSTLSDDFWKLENNNKWSSTMATSPQSTLCDGCKPKKPIANFAPARNNGLYLNQNQNQNQQPQVNQFQQLKQQQGNLPWGRQQMAVENRGRNRSNGGPLGLLSPSAWPTLQQSQQNHQPGSGTRPVFLGNPGANRQSSGTGVFIPRPVGTATETLKKPDRVVQSLNLNLKTMDASAQLQYRSTSNNAAISSDYDAALTYRTHVLMAEAEAQQRWNAAIQPQPVPMSNEIQLPQEWTY